MKHPEHQLQVVVCRYLSVQYPMVKFISTGTSLKLTGKHCYDISNFGFGVERPFAITIWLYIICDNLLHIICNYIALLYL